MSGDSSINFELHFSVLSGKEKDIFVGYIIDHLAQKGVYLSPDEIKKVRARFIKCSSSGCRCKRDPKYYHGPYLEVIPRSTHNMKRIFLGRPPDEIMKIIYKYHDFISNQSLAKKCRLIGDSDYGWDKKVRTVSCPTF